MTQHGVAETKNKLSALIERAEHGEEIVITRHGKPVAKLSGVPADKPAPKRITKEAIEWLETHRVGSIMPEEDAGTFVSRMRDEDWPR
ncbi:MAG: type II toxin-antitoxin system prevent-host-death family antitoxin [Rhizomicrobium sp.]